MKLIAEQHPPVKMWQKPIVFFKELFRLLKLTFTKWKNRKPFYESAVIAYCAIFSIPGLLVLVISIAGYFFGEAKVSDHLSRQIGSAMGADTADSIGNMIRRAHENTGTTLAGILGLITILIGATGVFAQLQALLNNIWEVKPDIKKSGILAFLKIRLFSFGLILSIAFLLLISLVISSVLAVMADWVKVHWPDYILFLFEFVDFLISVGVITVLFALMFKILPDARLKWKHVWSGALLTALLFIVGKWLLALYFGKANPGEGYGPAGSVVLILLWVSYSSMIVFFGAEFTNVYTQRYHGKVQGNKNTVPNKQA